MKFNKQCFTAALGCIIMLHAHANQVISSINIDIQGKQAKVIYNFLTGSSVQNDGAAGHLYRSGKNIVCRYTNADMDDKKGKPVSRDDAKRYSCNVKIDNNGNVLQAAAS